MAAARCLSLTFITSPSDDPHAAVIPPFGTHPPSILQIVVRRIGRRLPQAWLGRRIAAWLRHLVKQTAEGPVDVSVFDFPMRLWLQDNACERRLMVTPHFFDPIEFSLLRRLVCKDFQFVDLGANAGIYSLFVGRLAGPGAKILSVEPQPVMLARLRANIALNQLRVHIAATAVSENAGTAEFAVHSSNLGYTSINTRRRGRGERRIVLMPTRPLLDLVTECGFTRIDALKADIEGAEDRALIPFMEQAPSYLWPKLFIIEDNRREWARDCFSFLEDRGYRRINGSGNIMLTRESSGICSAGGRRPGQAGREATAL